MPPERRLILWQTATTKSLVGLNMPGGIAASNLDRAVSKAKRQLSMMGAAAADDRQVHLPFALKKQEDQFKLGRKEKL